MADTILLVDSTICRLCAEDNINGTQLFNNCENEPDLSTTINRYLPIKIKNDGKYPKTICPGCNIQLEAMVQFMELIISGQQKLRELIKIQIEYQKNKEKTVKKLLGENLFRNDMDHFTIQAVEDDGKEILLQIMSDGSLFSPEHDLSLKIEGLEKPRRKRGRPPKPPPPNEGEIEIEENPLKLDENEENDDNEEIETEGRSKRRRRKVPPRLLETVQGKELDRIFREEGVIDPNSSSDEEPIEITKKENQVGFDGNDENEVIGHLENLDGQDLGEIVVLSKGTNRKKFKQKKKKNFICEICNRGFTHHETYLLHKVYHKENKFECLDCNELFENNENLTLHQLETGHTGKNQDMIDEENLIPEENCIENENLDYESEESLKTINCKLCDKNFCSKSSYEIHIKAIHEGQKPFQCEKCDKSFAYNASLKSHLLAHEEKSNRGYSCDLCEKTFNHPSSVVYHKEAEHNNGRRFVCNKCKKCFKHKQLLQRHQLVHSNERPFACKNCNATFKTKANLVNHMPTHTGVKKFFCQQCGQLFAHKTSLTLHYRWHSGQKPYECQICKKAFSQKGNLQEHMRIHTGEKPYSCDHCDRKFTTSSQYKLHIKRHTGERPWSCDICTKTFLHKDTWKCHMRRHRDERPYQCDICQRGFTEQHALKKHMRLHTGEKPYTCDICGKAFADCSNLTKHKKVHRDIKLQNLATGDGNQIFYVTFDQNQTNSEDMPIQTLVQILEDPPLEGLSENSTPNDHMISETNTLVIPDGQNQIQTTPELHLESLDNTNEELSLPSNQVHIQDEEGNPIYYTTSTGEQLRVLTFDGENLQVRTDDGQIIPIQLNIENGKPVAVAVDSNEDIGTKDITMDDLINTKVEDKNVSDEETNEVNNLINQSMQFITEDGQNVCFVLDSENLNPNYLSIN